MKFGLKKLWSWLLVLAMAINLIPAQAIEIDSPESPNTYSEGGDQPQSGTDAAADGLLDLGTVSILMENVEKRTEFSKEFKLTNGFNMAVVYPEAVHYEKEGQWEDIDNTLHSVGTGNTAVFRTTAGAWCAEFPQQIQEGAQVQISKNGYNVCIALVGQLRRATDETATYDIQNLSGDVQTCVIAPEQNIVGYVQALDYSQQKAQAQYSETILETLASRLSYAGIYESTDIVYDISSDQLAETVEISEYDAALSGYQYLLNTGVLRPVANEDGSIALQSPDTQEVIMTVAAPFMVDDNGVACSNVAVELEATDNGYLLTYTLPTQWLAAEARAWPVVMSRGIEIESDTQNIMDCVVSSSGNSIVSDGMLAVGYVPTHGIMRSYIKYINLPALDPGDFIVSASLSLLTESDQSGSTRIEAHAVNEVWTEDDLTWYRQPEFDSTIEDFCNVGIFNDYDWDITDIVREWYTEANTGVMLKVPNERENGIIPYWVWAYGADAASNSSGTYPQIRIILRNSNGLENYWDYTTVSASRAGSGYVNNYTGNLTWVRADLGFGGNRMPVSISHIYNTGNASVNTYGLGNGWQTNYHQSLETVYEPGYGVDDVRGYLWTDGDGTEHFFPGKRKNFVDNGIYKDADGLELRLIRKSPGYAITDKYGNTSTFDGFGRLTAMTNNQEIQSSISITYTTTTGMQIASITDGVGRRYSFVYNDGLLSEIAYYGKGESKIASVSYAYIDSQLAAITDQDGGTSAFTYGSNGLLASVTDVDGYQIRYAYSDESAPLARVVGIEEWDGALEGSALSIEYAHNQTTLTDHNGHMQILQFNDWGNVISIQDDQGRAQFARYAMNKYDESGGKGNQLTLSSKMQNTVVNQITDSSFEWNGAWSLPSAGTSTQEITSLESYMGNKSLKITASEAGRSVNAYYQYTLPANTSCTFSAYVKTDSAASVCLGIGSLESIYATSEVLSAGSDWTRLQVTYTNDSDAAVDAFPLFISDAAGTAYMDCAQLEMTVTASRYNLIENGDFGSNLFWSATTGRTAIAQAATVQLDNNVYKFIGNPDEAQSISQTVQVSGGEGDTFVLSGWAKGDSVPLRGNRQFAIIGKFIYTDGTTSDPFTAQFNPDADSSINWQYSAQVMVAEKDYSSVQVEIAYDYNVNTVYFDGIQLFKEEFGNSYTYDENGNVISVVDLQRQLTTYEYDGRNDLRFVRQVIGDTTVTKMTYDYDSYHNVVKATSAEGLVYEFTYDQWGNNTSVSISNGSNKVTSSAAYSDDGNILVSTTDALAKVTQYGYNGDTNVLQWVQYPEDTEATRTEYSYDTMYRLASVAADVDSGYSLDATYTYTEDLLTALETNSTTYNFCYGAFSQISAIRAGTRLLASYTYTNTQDRYLQKLTYGNNDYVRYVYDDYGRVTQEIYEDGDTVTYTYNNSGALATVTDSATGITTTYYYDFTDRLMKCVETGTDYYHSVGYQYDSLNNLTLLVETINGAEHTTGYTYDEDNRVATVTQDGRTESLTYDALGRLIASVFNLGELESTRSYTYNPNSTQIAELDITAGEYEETYSYTYDGNGNILSVRWGDCEITYVYDSANQLVRENNQQQNKTWTWEYDDAGNLLSKTEYAYTTEELGEPLDTVLYAYGDTDWGDLLTAFDGNPITYDGMGNPLSDGTWTYTWAHGRELASMSAGDEDDGEVTISYGYDANGMRTSKTVTVYTYEDVVVHTHSYGKLTIVPTCTERGYALYVCGCGIQYKDDYVPALGHNFVNAAIGSARICLRCGYVDSVGVITPIRPPTPGEEIMSVETIEGAPPPDVTERMLVSTTETTYGYVYDGGQLRQMTITITVTADEETTTQTETLEFTYDASGAPQTVTSGNTTYLYATNLQGDVVAILDSSGNTVVEYTYDAWGNLLSTNSSVEDHPVAYNPLRYRGYVYDTETELYYLQSRYYDSAICRFINADSYASTGQGILGCNMFAYCNNSPVINKDSTGNFLCTAIGALIGGGLAAIGAAIEGKSGDEFWASVASGATSGAISGAAADIILVTGGSAAVVAGVMAGAGALGAIAGNGVESVITGEKMSLKQTVTDVFWGAATGALFGYMGGDISSNLGKYASRGVWKATRNILIKEGRKLVSTIGEEVLSGVTADLLEFTLEAIGKQIVKTILK